MDQLLQSGAAYSLNQLLIPVAVKIHTITVAFLLSLLDSNLVTGLRVTSFKKWLLARVPAITLLMSIVPTLTVARKLKIR